MSNDIHNYILAQNIPTLVSLPLEQSSDRWVDYDDPSSAFQPVAEA